MVLFTCIKCSKTFNKKSSFIIHTEHKKKPCFIKTDHMAPDLHLAKKIAPDLLFEKNMAPDLRQEHNFKNNIECLIKTKEYRTKEEIKITDTDNKEDDIKIINESEDICNNIKCEYCDKFFVKLYGLNRHLKSCNIKKDIIHINVVNYKEEDLSKLDLKKILTYDNSFIEMVFRDIHCNPILPENQNILLPSLTRYDIYIKLNNEWLKRNKKEILTERYTTIRGYIMDMYDKESNINKSKADKEYFHFLKQIKLVDPSNVIYKPKEEKKIIDGIANVLYNHKDNIKSIDKTPLIINKNK